MSSTNNTAKACGRSLPISTKHSIEIGNLIRGEKLDYSKKILNEVIAKKKAVPLKRFNKGAGHKKKIGPGRYPEKASLEILKLLESAEANAQFKGLNTANLIISSISANRASTQWHYGRQRRRKMKRTHIDIIVREEGKKK